MKLNHAAVLSISVRRSALVLATGFSFLLPLAGAASALDGIDLSVPAESTAAGECPQLIQIKYPFLSCAKTQIGQSDADEVWDNSRSIPIQSNWIEGNSWWGPDLNQD